MRAFLFCLIILSSESCFAFSIRSLWEYKSFEFSSLSKGKTIWILYRPDCSSCLYQFKELKCFKRLDQFRVVGFGGNEKRLKDESRHFENLEKIQKNNASPFYGDKEVLKNLGVDKDLSPQILIYENQKKIVHHIGALKCSQLQKMAD